MHDGGGFMFVKNLVETCAVEQVAFL